jgi:hypothetical protein
LNGIYRAREFGKHAIASGIGNSPAMLSNKAVHNFARGSEGAQRTGLVLAHQARVPGHVCREDRCQTPFDPLLLPGFHSYSPALGTSCFGRQWGARVA